MKRITIALLFVAAAPAISFGVSYYVTKQAIAHLRAAAVESLHVNVDELIRMVRRIGDDRNWTVNRLGRLGGLRRPRRSTGRQRAGLTSRPPGVPVENLDFVRVAHWNTPTTGGTSVTHHQCLKPSACPLYAVAAMGTEVGEDGCSKSLVKRHRHLHGLSDGIDEFGQRLPHHKTKEHDVRRHTSQTSGWIGAIVAPARCLSGSLAQPPQIDDRSPRFGLSDPPTPSRAIARPACRAHHRRDHGSSARNRGPKGADAGKRLRPSPFGDAAGASQGPAGALSG